MPGDISIALAQINPTVGDLAGNAAKLTQARAEAARQGADLVVGAELCLSGYPPEDLVLKPAFLDRVESEARALAAATADGGPGLLIGAPWRENGRVHNSALLLDGGGIASVRHKHHLPNYGVFDEMRIFAPGPCPGPVSFRGFRLGVMVCEDMWFPDVAECLQESGAQALLVLNGSPFESDKPDRRTNHAVARVLESGLALAYVNQVGGQDELVFDGGSFVLDRDRRLVHQAPAWRECLAVTRWRRADGVLEPMPGEVAPPLDADEALYQALMLGLRDYVNKNGFPGVILGLSGGIDSALTAALAVDALGAARVRSVMMPSRYTSRDSLEDAEACAANLGIRLNSVSIEPAAHAFAQMLEPLNEGKAPDITEENIQARVRGIILMGISNKFGPMVVSTGNKSEMSVGYSTLYGDMCGGFAILKDVYKMTVYRLSRWRNVQKPLGGLGPIHEIIPERILTKAPTAELRPNQTDQDSLPPYDILDDILECLIENEMGIDEIVRRGHVRSLVTRVWRMLDRAEYKRRQAPPGVKITSRAFGRDRRYPITNRFEGA